MTRAEFEQVVQEAMESIPEFFREKLRNVEVIVQDIPPRRHLRPGRTLFGIYEGVPFGEPGRGFTGQMPDRITIFRNPIEGACGDRTEMLTCIRETVLHEVGHHFGFTDRQLEEMGY